MFVFPSIDVCVDDNAWMAKCYLYGSWQERGVRVMPEIETPGHGACRAKVVPQLNLSTCPDVLNPTLNGTYDFLLTLLSEISPIFPEPTIFLGGDEVKYALDRVRTRNTLI